MVEMLSAAGGAPVSFVALRDAGIEFPAAVVSELELAGARIERCRVGAEVAVRADAAGVWPTPLAPTPPAPPPPPPSRRAPRVGDTGVRRARDTSVRMARAPARAGRPRARPRVLAPILAAACVAIVGLAVVGLLSGGEGGSSPARTSASTGERREATQSRPRARAPSANGARTANGAGSANGAHAEHGSPPGREAAVPVSSALAVRLEAQGHQLVEDGGYAAAVPVLRRALAATGKQLTECLEPAGEACLTYAYALYDLGHALQMDGHAARAVTVLQDRMEIDNQRSAVQSELALARAEAG